MTDADEGSAPISKISTAFLWSLVVALSPFLLWVLTSRELLAPKPFGGLDVTLQAPPLTQERHLRSFKNLVSLAASRSTTTLMIYYSRNALSSPAT